MSSYDGTICMNRKLTEEETHELRIKLIPYFTTDGGMGVDDMADFLDYIFTMVSNSKAVEYVVKELDGFCSPETSAKIGKELADSITLFNGASSSGDSNEDKRGSGTSPGKRVVSLKSSAEKGNALTQAGALGASRLGGRGNKKETPKPQKKSPERSEQKQEKKQDAKKEERNRNDRRDSDQKGGRGSRSVQGAAFDRLAKGNDRRDSRGPDHKDVDRRRDDRGDRRGRGRGGDRDRDRDNAPDRTPRRDDRPPRRDDRSPRRDERGSGREDRGEREGRVTPGRGPRDMGGRGHRDMAGRGPREGGRSGGRDGGRGRGGRDDRMSGQRRPRDDLESEPDFVPTEENGGRRFGTPADAHPGRDVPKRPRYEDWYAEGYGYDAYGGGNDHFDGGYGFSPYPAFRGGRGFRGRGRGRGRGGRGFEDGGEAPTETTPPGEGQPMAEDGSGIENVNAHPSPMVQAAFGAFDYGGRGFFRGGRGRGRGRGGRAQVLSMIQSKTWVRKKDDEAGDANANANANANPNGDANGAPSGDTES